MLSWYFHSVVKYKKYIFYNTKAPNKNIVRITVRVFSVDETRIDILEFYRYTIYHGVISGKEIAKYWGTSSLMKQHRHISSLDVSIKPMCSQMCLYSNLYECITDVCATIRINEPRSNHISFTFALIPLEKAWIRLIFHQLIKQENILESLA